MSAQERIAGNMLEGAVFIKSDKPTTESAKVTKSLEETLAQVNLEWIEE